MKYLSLALALLFTTPTSAAHLVSAKPAPQGTCELACQYKDGTGPKRITTCTERITEAKCKSIADHKNTSDAYPNKMTCEARINETCKAVRAF
ncbi:MAG: hypothetical protein V4441_10755 [Pseudomonadota bacterium]